jgi:hypothetical protein
MADEELLAAQRATERAEHFRGLMTLIRGRTDATAKGLAAVGTAAVSAIGYASLADFFPFDGPPIAGAGLFAGLAAMVFSVIKLVQRFEDSADTIITYADAERTRERSQLGPPEFTTLTKEYEAMAKLNQVDSLRAYSARAHRFERIADACADPALAATLRARADAIQAEVQAVQDRAVVFILRERAKEAFFHKKAIRLLILFLVGWYGTALSADAIRAERSEAPPPQSAASASALKPNSP